MKNKYLALLAAPAAAGILIACWPAISVTQDQSDPFGSTPASQVVSHSKQENTEAAIRDELAKETTLELSEKPLTIAAKYLEEKCRTPVVFDQAAFREAGIDPAATLASIDVHGITLRSGLRLMLEPLNLTYIIKDEALQITTKDKASTELTTGIYDVRDLVTPEGGGDRDFDSLISVLTESIATESWFDKGGQGSCQAGPLGTLVVFQTDEIQRQVSDLLAAMRLARAQSKAGIFDHTIVADATPANQRIETLLADKIDLSADAISLNDLMSRIGKQKDVPIHIDQEALKNAGIDPAATQVSKKLSGLSLRSALKLILQDYNLATMIHDEVLQVTSKDRAGSELNTRLYPIGDLVDPALAACADDESPDAVIDSIMSAVAPESWTEMGGQGTIQPYGPNKPILVITQTDELHSRIDDLLAQFREVQRKQRAQAGVAVQPPSSPEKLVLKIYQIRDTKTDPTAMTPQEVAEAIQGLVEPKSWSKPDTYIHGFTGKLVVRQSPAVHREIDKVLEKLGAKPPKVIGVIPVVGQNGQQPAGDGFGGGGFGGFGGGGLGRGGFGGGGF